MVLIWLQPVWILIPEHPEDGKTEPKSQFDNSVCKVLKKLSISKPPPFS